MTRTAQVFVTLIFALAASVPSRAQDISKAPEAATGYAPKQLEVATHHMIVAANPLAASAGLEMLRAGGSAVDAAIATQLVLGLVEPQSSGLGGGAFLIHWDAAGKSLKTYDGRETAPAAAKPDRFLRDGQPVPFGEAMLSGQSVGVPGVVGMMALAHKQHGKLPWARLFEPAVQLAESGFAMSARLANLLAGEKAENFAPLAREYFFDADGRPREAGSILRNPAYAETLKYLAGRGAGAFYDSPVADAIIGTAAAFKGDLALSDFAAYRAIERPAQCSTYREHTICGMGPPSSGATTIGQTLKLVEPLAAIQGQDAAMTPAALHAIGEAEKLAYADRSRYLADPDFTAIPSGLLDDGYLADRRRLIDPARAMEKPKAGLPPGLSKKTQGADATQENAGTSHLSVVDDAGNAVAMTTSIEAAFGSHLWVGGFLLNNTMTDFSFRPVDLEGNKIANAIEPGKRPRSSMAPTMVFDKNGELEAVTGTPGGPKIILIVVKTLVAMLDWGMDAEAAAAVANFGSEGGPFQLESGPKSAAAAEELKRLGHTIVPDAMASGVHTIVRRNGHLEGGADPRREGIAIGD